ncbi:MAG: alanine racemase [Hyphomicrobium sp.]|jgi:alanine racemase|uniref:alanine racemase n=1 Tax=Hyphomicrobium sp. TaxID=82 RepID=UPI0025C0442B|nr:alanine racemase [Hyphomicrobium sp.]MBX9861345.1 alanine racemase [Hyphomicrobium sp.]
MSAPGLPADATGLITVDLDALCANWRALAQLVAPAECGAVVKADAYGLGAAEVIPALARAGCRTFFIATPEEASAARRLVPSARLFALDGLVPGSAQNFIAADVAPVLSGLDEIADWSAHARQAGRRLPAALHVDSGLNRLGLSADDVSILASERERLEHLDVRLVMSHLACADDPDHPHNARQRAAFEQRRATLALPSASASLAASDGLMLGAPFHYDLVRPGYALYGGQAFQGGATPVNPVVTVAAGILQVRTVDAGESVGYSASWVAPRQTRVAIVAAGYADGLGRGLSASSNETGGIVMVHGQSAPIVGRVSMDLITVDVTDVVGRVQRGDLVTLIGPGLTIEAMGRAAGTIGYEVLTRLGTRFARRYVGGGA